MSHIFTFFLTQSSWGLLSNFTCTLHLLITYNIHAANVDYTTFGTNHVVGRRRHAVIFCSYIAILEDSEIENQEEFFLRIQSEDGVMESPILSVIILDNDDGN